jgi:hypothetical protein
MLVLVLVGVVVAALGLVFESEFVIAVGVTLAALSPLGFLVPGFREVRSPERVDRESYFGFVLNLFHTTPDVSVADRREVPAGPPGRSEPRRSSDPPADSPR